MKKLKPSENIFLKMKKLPFFLLNLTSLLRLYDDRNDDIWESLSESNLKSKYKNEVLKRHSAYKLILMNFVLSIVAYFGTIIVFFIAEMYFSGYLLSILNIVLVVLMIFWFFMLTKINANILKVLKKKTSYSEYVKLVKQFNRTNITKKAKV